MKDYFSIFSSLFMLKKMSSRSTDENLNSMELNNRKQADENLTSSELRDRRPDEPVPQENGVHQAPAERDFGPSAKIVFFEDLEDVPDPGPCTGLMKKCRDRVTGFYQDNKQKVQLGLYSCLFVAYNTYLVWAIVLGYLVFGEIPGLRTLAGGAIIVACGIYVIYRERQIANADANG